VARVAAASRIRMSNPTGVVSFSFDDVPQSGCRKGRGILESLDVAGTYYISGGFTQKLVDGGEPFHDWDDLRSLMGGEHELGSHGYGHLNYQQISIDEVRADLEKNRQFFSELGLERPLQSFAYPYGCLNTRVKRACAELFASCRGVLGGINTRTVDRSLVKAVPLYSWKLTERKVASLIERAERDAGWLVFYSHSVIPHPNAFGCTPQLLEFAVRTAVRSNCRVLPVGQALEYVQQAHPV